MDKLKQKVTLNADGKEISVLHFGGENDYISLTDIAKYNNPDFKPVEFDGFKSEAGANAFTLSPQKWIGSTNSYENSRLSLSGIIYANEADVLNMALFGKTAKKWREENPEAKGNLRDFATYQQLSVLVNLDSMNAELIKIGLSQNERALRLNKMAIEQMSALAKYNPAVKQIEGK